MILKPHWSAFNGTYSEPSGILIHHKAHKLIMNPQGILFRCRIYKLSKTGG
ncbi:MAG: hypothetical protein BWY95_01207 [Bacteroidetes bacterium ADurb.BinA104]|nr:MAG: hypothetical protein BWY95_01207 [Bacteroidetes bacterium ADurb.BinA104]